MFTVLLWSLFCYSLFCCSPFCFLLFRKFGVLLFVILYPLRVRGSRHLLAAHFLWHGMNKDVKDWASICLDCQRLKIAKHVRLPNRSIDMPWA